MKKLLLSAMALVASVSASFAQDVPYCLKEVENNVYAVTDSLAYFEANYDATWVSDAWSNGASLPAGTVMYENDEVKISAAVDGSFVLTSYTTNLSDIQKDHPSYQGAINLGSTLNQNFDETVVISDEEITAYATSYHAVVAVEPKVDGTLTVQIYAGNNKRSAGIWEKATEEEWDTDTQRGWAVVKTWRHGSLASDEWLDDELEYDESLEKSAKNLTCTVSANRTYYIFAGGGKNMNLAQTTFVPTDETGVAGVTVSEEGKTVVAYYSIDGKQISQPQNGVTIVKYSDGTSIKVVK